MQELPYIQSVALKRELVESFDTYPFSIPAVKGLDELEFGPEVTFLVGENGSGKSTLLEAIAVALGFNPEGGSKNFRFGTRESHSQLHRYLLTAKSYLKPRDGFFLRAESYFNVGTYIEGMDEESWLPGASVIGSYGGVSLHEQSHGESLMALLMHRLGGKGVYLFDEPEAALSPTRQLALMRRMKHLIEDKSQFIIATHSPILLAYPGAWIYQIDASGIQSVRYEDTELYQVTRAFLEAPERMLEEIFAD